MTTTHHGRIVDFAFEELIAARDSLRNSEDNDAQLKVLSLSVRLAESVQPRIVRHEYYGCGSSQGDDGSSVQ